MRREKIKCFSALLEVVSLTLLQRLLLAAERTGRTLMCIAIIINNYAEASGSQADHLSSKDTQKSQWIYYLSCAQHLPAIIVSWISNIRHNIIGTSTTVKVMRSAPHAYAQTHTHTLYEILFITTETNKFDFSSELFTGGD